MKGAARRGAFHFSEIRRRANCCHRLAETPVDAHGHVCWPRGARSRNPRRRRGDRDVRHNAPQHRQQRPLSSTPWPWPEVNTAKGLPRPRMPLAKTKLSSDAPRTLLQSLNTLRGFDVPEYKIAHLRSEISLCKQKVSSVVFLCNKTYSTPMLASLHSDYNSLRKKLIHSYRDYRRSVILHLATLSSGWRGRIE